MNELLFAVFVYLGGCCLALALINWINKQPQDTETVILLPTDLSYFSWLIVLLAVAIFIHKLFKL